MRYDKRGCLVKELILHISKIFPEFGLVYETPCIFYISAIWFMIESTRYSTLVFYLSTLVSGTSTLFGLLLFVGYCEYISWQLSLKKCQFCDTSDPPAAWNYIVQLILKVSQAANFRSISAQCHFNTSAYLKFKVLSCSIPKWNVTVPRPLSVSPRNLHDIRSSEQPTNQSFVHLSSKIEIMQLGVQNVFGWI